MARRRRKSPPWRERRARLRWYRKILWTKQKGLCWICGKRIDRRLPPGHDLGPTIDHIVPLSQGGTDSPENLALAHKICNWQRGDGTQTAAR